MTRVTISRDQVVSQVPFHLGTEDAVLVGYPFDMYTMTYEGGHCKVIRATQGQIARVIMRVGKQLPDDAISQLVDDIDHYKITTDLARLEVDAVPVEYVPPKKG